MTTSRPQSSVLLEAAEAMALTRIVGVELGPGSPLRHLPSSPASALDDAALERLQRRAVLRPDGTVNALAEAALRAASMPEEVISVGVGARNRTGFSLVRRNKAVAECTVSGDRVKLVFPLDRDTTLVGLMGMLSGPTADVRAGFHFTGSAAEIMVLSTVLAAQRETGTAPTVNEVRERVGQGRSSALAMSLDVSLGLGQATGLLPGDVDEVLESLAAQGVVATLDRVYPSPQLAAVTAHAPSASFAISRTEIVDGTTRTLQMTAARVGPYRLVFRQLAGGRFEWRDVTQAELRRSVATMWLTPDERTEAVAATRSVF